MRARFWVAIILAGVFASACGGGGSDCDAYVGTYTGTFTGTLGGAGDIQGTVTLVVTTASEEATSANLEGTWMAPGGYFGDINRSDLNCADGTVTYEYGVSLKGPTSVVCPPPCEPTASGGGCYCDGATLGEFSGTFSEMSGAGTWRADSGAAQTVGATGSGSWMVSR